MLNPLNRVGHHPGNTGITGERWTVLPGFEISRLPDSASGCTATDGNSVDLAWQGVTARIRDSRPSWSRLPAGRWCDFRSRGGGTV